MVGFWIFSMALAVLQPAFDNKDDDCCLVEDMQMLSSHFTTKDSTDTFLKQPARALHVARVRPCHWNQAAHSG